MHHYARPLSNALLWCLYHEHENIVKPYKFTFADKMFLSDSIIFSNPTQASSITVQD